MLRNLSWKKRFLPSFVFLAITLLLSQSVMREISSAQTSTNCSTRWCHETLQSQSPATCGPPETFVHHSTVLDDWSPFPVPAPQIDNNLNNVGSFPVVSNTINSITVQGIITSIPNNTNYTLFDDDDFNGNNGTNLTGDAGENVTAPDISLIQNSDNPSLNVFAPAYVRPIYDIGDNNDLVTFRLNSNTTTAANLIATYDFDSAATEGDANFWTVYLPGAYQPYTNEDGDPGTDGATLGIVDNLNGRGASVFVEILRGGEITITSVVNNAATTAHEIGHLFNGQHADGGLMAQSWNRTSTDFSAITLNTIRGLAYP